VLTSQIRTITGKREQSEFIDEAKVKVYRIEDVPTFSLYTKEKLKDINFISLSPE
jgi:hypothetical protein